ncbi:MAG TPA: RNA methyltransferase [bacterium]|jgi:23S rRNA (guanosine2251-2'-O)-methyltransferase
MARGNKDLVPVYGLHAVEAVLTAGRRPGRELWVARKEGEVSDRLTALAEGQGIAVRRAAAEELRRWAPQGGDQGFVLLAEPLPEVDPRGFFDDLRGRDDALVVILDRVQDPHNLGSLLRVAACYGVDGVITARHRSVALTPAAVKVASGAAEHVPVVAVGGLVEAVESCKAAGLWLFAADEAAAQAAADTDLTGPVGLVLGGEGVGLRSSVLRACDGAVSLARGGALATLNVAMAGAVLLYEVRRQRDASPRGDVDLH